MNEYVSDENRLEEWGGTDPWQYVWEPEAGQAPEGEFKLQNPKNIPSNAQMNLEYGSLIIILLICSL